MSIATIARPELVLTSLADLALQKARKAEFVVRLGAPLAVLNGEGATANVSRRLKDGLLKVPECQLQPYQAKLEEMLMLSHITRAGLEELGLNMRPHALEAGLVLGVRKPEPDLRLYTVETSGFSTNGNGVHHPEINGHSLLNGNPDGHNGYHSAERHFPFELVYISGEVVEGLADRIYQTGSKGIDLAVLCGISDLAEEKARLRRKSAVWEADTMRTSFEEVRSVTFPKDVAKLLHRYARQTRKAQMYSNRAL